MTAAAMAATTDSLRPPVRRRQGPDRLTVILFATAAFLAVLALLISQLHPAAAKPRVVVVRRLYQTTVVETILGQRAAATSVSRSTSSTGGEATAPLAPTTRVS